MNLKELVKNSLEDKLSKLHEVELDVGLEKFITMNGMEEAINKLIKHINNKSKIRIVGDYDSDGIMATVTMISFFQKHPELKNVDISYFIPDRMIHGYGVSPLIIEEAKNDGIDLIITVDNGIAAIDAINRANELSIDVIITDHHTPPKILPNIDTIINPKAINDLSFQEISGATVAYCFCNALNRKLNIQIDMEEFLDLPALTVLSDVMPLEDINRKLLISGFKSIQKNDREIYSKVFTNEQRNNLTTNDISFNLVPKINATGRLANANLGVKMFLENEVDSILAQIENINETRKDVTHESLLKIIDEATIKNEKYNCIVVYKEGLHEGVVGILASRLVEAFNKPAFVLTDSHGMAKGSARSLGTINVYDLLTKQNHLLVKFGGHAGAAGLSLKVENINELQELMHQDLVENFTKEDYVNKIEYFEISKLNELDLELTELLQSYEPYGAKFEKPLFKIKVKLESIDKNKENKHYFCTIKDKLFTKKQVWFFHCSENMENYLGQTLEIYIDTSFNYFQGRKNISLIGKLIK